MKKVIHYNFKPDLKKGPRKAVLLKSILKNKALKTKSDVNIAAYKKQRNNAVALNQNPKSNCFNNLDINKELNIFGKPFASHFLNKYSREDTSIIII